MKGKDLITELENNMSLFTILDDSFCVEIAALKAVQGEEGKEFIQKRILSCFPEGPSEKDWNIVLQELQVLKALCYTHYNQ